MESTYQYTALPEGAHIRLILLQPGSFDEDIKFDLKSFSFTALPEYEALSYAWGPSSQPLARSTVDGKYTITITASLALALRHLRWKERDRVLWVDAICINQIAEVEKGIQVSFIGEIYAKATRVVVWVGVEEGESQRAIRFLEEISLRKKQYARKRFVETRAEIFVRERLERTGCRGFGLEIEAVDDVDDEGDGDHIGADADSLDRFGDPIVERRAWRFEDHLRFFEGDRDGDWSALDALLRRVWFSRVWVVQEVWRASRVTIQCGNTFLEWTVFRNAMRYIQTWDDWEADRISGHFKIGKWEGLKRRYSLALHISTPGVGARLMSLLFNTWDRDATNPRDKVFSILGLADPHAKDSLQVDYTKDVNGVFIECAAFIIKDEHSLEILMGGSGLRRGAGLPSWVPDWRRAALENRPALFVNRTKTFTFFSTGSMIHYGTKDFPYRASGSSKTSFSISNDSRILTVACKMIDVIERVEGGSATGLDLGARLNRAQELSMPNVLNRQDPENEAWLASYETQRQLCDVLMAGNCDEEDVKNMDEVLQNVMTYRRFFVTKSGLMGVGPETIEVGHLACVIAGCSIPYVVSKEAGHYLLVGEAFVLHMMDGEIVRRKEVPWKNINLH